jgi:hypothetical protein
LKFVAHRIADRRLVRLLAKWLRAGVMEKGEIDDTDEGTPQGGVISPLLANIYLHYVFDLWVARWRGKEARQEVYVVRYADDFVVGLEDGRDARRLQKDLRGRLEQFGLTLHEEKTRLLRFGRYAEERERAVGRKPGTFDFLGFTHAGGRDGAGLYQLQRFTAKRKRVAKYAELREEIRRRRHAPVPETHRWLSSVLHGYYRYYAVPTNRNALYEFRWQLQLAWEQVLARRSQKARWNVRRRLRFRSRWRLPDPVLHHPWPERRA